MDVENQEVKEATGLYSDFWDREDHTKHALFMDSIPKDISSDPTLCALQQIAEEALQTPMDVFNHWKSVGNAAFLESSKLPKRCYDALDAYKKALDVPDVQPHVRGVVLSNRAIVYNKVGRYVEAYTDCLNAIAGGCTTQKLFFNCARAYMGLKLYAKALEYLEKGLAEFPESQELIDYHAVVMKHHESTKEAHRFEKERICTEQQEVALRLKQLKLTVEPDCLYSPYKGTVSISKEGSLRVPVIIIFEKEAFIEALAAVDETGTFGDVMSVAREISQAWTDHKPLGLHEKFTIEVDISRTHREPVELDTRIYDVLIKMHTLYRNLTVHVSRD